MTNPQNKEKKRKEIEELNKKQVAAILKSIAEGLGPGRLIKEGKVGVDRIKEVAQEELVNVTFQHFNMMSDAFHYVDDETKETIMTMTKAWLCAYYMRDELYLEFPLTEQESIDMKKTIDDTVLRYRDKTLEKRKKLKETKEKDLGRMYT